MVDIENLNTDGSASRYEEPILYAPGQSGREQRAAVKRSLVGPRVVGPAEILIFVVFVAELVALPFVKPAATFCGAIGIGCCLGLPAMLAAWSFIRRSAWRYALTVFLSLFNGILLIVFVSPKFDFLLAMVPLSSVLPVWVALFVVKRTLGYVRTADHDADKFLEGLRFNLSHLFIVTTLLVILLPVGKLLWGMLGAGLGKSEMAIIFACLSALISFNTIMFVWALLGKQAILRTCIAIPIGGLALAVCLQVCCKPNSHLLQWCLLAGLPLVLSFLLLAAFRFSGWRFFRGTTS